eukprot:GHVR01166307.1.p1 GENE.GHVR01166307.1~~GHVR01166307.1.p1  ORF type:complete len:109 (+),score=20.25 GHVR01166307.1:25-351(+)
MYVPQGGMDLPHDGKNQQMDQEQRRRMEEQKAMMEERRRQCLQARVAPEALQRLNRLALVKPEKSRKVEDFILNVLLFYYYFYNFDIFYSFFRIFKARSFQMMNYECC